MEWLQYQKLYYIILGKINHKNSTISAITYQVLLYCTKSTALWLTNTVKWYYGKQAHYYSIQYMYMDFHYFIHGFTTLPLLTLNGHCVPLHNK